MRPGEVPIEESVDVLVRVVPRASRNEVGPERGGRLIVRTQAAPVDDQANEAVGRALAKHFGVRRRDVQLVAGARDRDKTFRVHGVARGARLERLTVAASDAAGSVRPPRRQR